jgi:hypothetical protein
MNDLIPNIRLAIPYAGWLQHKVILPVMSFREYQKVTKYRFENEYHNGRFFRIFTQEILDWIDMNITGSWTKPCCYSRNNNFIYEFCITFEYEEDALAFQMKWL